VRDPLATTFVVTEDESGIVQPPVDCRETKHPHCLVTEWSGEAHGLRRSTREHYVNRTVSGWDTPPAQFPRSLR
jgi:hypothetical protein